MTRESFIEFSVGDWNDYSNYYDALNEIVPYREMLREVARHINLGHRHLILDAGCGTGNLEYWLGEENESSEAVFICADYSDVMLRKARSKQIGIQRIFMKIDFNYNLPFIDEIFETIVSVNNLYALKSPGETVSSFFRALKPGGNLLLVNPKKGGQNGMILKEHCGDSGLDEEWIIRNEEEYDYKAKKVIQRAIKDPILAGKFFAIAEFNKKIAATNRFNFYDEEEFFLLVEKCGFKITEYKLIYANQAIFLNLHKRR